jgi:hypothetical protein
MKGKMSVMFLMMAIASHGAVPSLQTVTWYLNNVSVPNIPSFDTGNGDFDDTPSDHFLNATNTLGGITTATASTPFMANTSTFTPCLAFTLKTFTNSPTGCIYMGKADQAQFSSYVYQTKF